MKKMNKAISVLIMLMLLAIKGNSQISNYIYGVNNASNGVYYFSKFEISTGILTDLQAVSLYQLSSGSSSCIDDVSKKFYLCTNDTLITFDVITGSIISTIPLPLASNESFYYAQFYPCDSSIYGVISNGTTSPVFARYTPSTGLLTSIASYSNTSGFCGGCMSIIDPVNELFILERGTSYPILAFDLNTGAIAYSTPIIDLTNERFGHIALKCNTGQIYGTSYSFITGTKYLATINLFTGVVSHVSTTAWNQGIAKPSLGGTCFNQLSNNYYYSGHPNVLNGGNVMTGNLSSQNLAAGLAFEFIEHFSQCPCIITGSEENNLSFNNLSIFPNPSASGGTIRLTFNTKHNAPVQCEIVNMMGERVYQTPLPASPQGGEEGYAVLDVSFLAKGMDVSKKFYLCTNDTLSPLIPEFDLPPKIYPPSAV